MIGTMANNKLKLFFILLLFCAFFVHSYNAYIYGHFHKLENGTFTFHSHPYEQQESADGAQPNHSHSPLDLLVYELLNILFFVFIIFILLIWFFSSGGAIFRILTKNLITLATLPIRPLRGPPHPSL